MFSFTKYSVFFFTELRYRSFYIFFSFIIISLYSIIYLNLFLILFLKPIEYLNTDLSLNYLSTFLFDTFLYDLYDIVNINNKIIVSNTFYRAETYSFFDFFPVFEININNNNYLYFYLFLYLILLFIIPISFYHIYLFIIPGLFKYELYYLNNIIFFFYFSLFSYLKYLNTLFVYLILCFSYNNFYEFLNYEFDIEFNLLYFIKLHIMLLMLFYINIIIFILYFTISIKKRLFIKNFFIILNLYFFISIFIYFFFILLLFLLNYLYYAFYNINNFTLKKKPFFQI